MSLTHQPTGSSDADRDLPRRLWRQLLLRSSVQVGGTALVIGTQPLTAAERLCEFGLDVLALCHDPAAVMTGRLRCPAAEFQPFDPTRAWGLSAQAYDLALVLDTEPCPANLLSREARLVTASVLSALKPGGRLLWRHESRPEAPHHSGCWFRHLACFPGEIDVQSVSVPWWPLSAWHPVRRRETTLVEFTIPAAAVSPAEWRHCVDTGLLTDRRSCCAGAVESAIECRVRAA
uniref:Class I SAM-dependent methyltransferase n=1 Tax=Schlesneria paludicola TaxID=360056 RepID=A0A7C2P1Z1_9PLAN